MRTTIAFLTVLAAAISAQFQPQVYTTASLPPSAQITTPPSAEALELRKRVANSLTSICGYLPSVSPLWSFYCDSGYYCGFNGEASVFGCCGINTENDSFTNCYEPTTCADYGKLSTRNSIEEWLTHSCTDSAYPYCATFYESGMSAMGCNESPYQTGFLQFTLNGAAASSTSIAGVSISSSTFIDTVPSHTGTATVTAAIGPVTSSTAFSVTQASGSTNDLPSSSTSSNNHGVRQAKDGRLDKLVVFVVGLVIQGL